jgi:diaminohydroxyphosphoribosylaminopyrimidine deaminase / 5-amino-6-(5-phosphoribosylamino)uracil reductase
MTEMHDPELRHNDADLKLMGAALREARKALGNTSPNPAVGAVLALDGKIVSSGYHAQAGAPHAEVECLRQFKKPIPKRAVLYVTLEPCATTGRTGPCTKAILNAGVQHVVIGTTDPNPKQSGRGIRILKDAGVDVRSGILGDECTRLNETYNKWITTKLPFVIAKCGMTLDGRLSAPPRESPWITSAASRRHAHSLRAQVDAILIGANTLRNDNPRLTVRGVGRSEQPWRIVLSKSGPLPKDAHLFTDRHKDRTLVCRAKSLKRLLQELSEREITSVLIEGGGDVLGQALDERLVDKIQIYVGSKFTAGPVVAFGGKGAGSTNDAARIERVKFEQIGDDICVTGYPVYAQEPKEAKGKKRRNESSD